MAIGRGWIGRRTGGGGGAGGVAQHGCCRVGGKEEVAGPGAEGEEEGEQPFGICGVAGGRVHAEPRSKEIAVVGMPEEEAGAQAVPHLTAIAGCHRPMKAGQEARSSGCVDDGREDVGGGEDAERDAHGVQRGRECWALGMQSGWLAATAMLRVLGPQEARR